jgi:hypothetical protein
MADIPYGNRRADILTQLSQRERLEFIAEGLPIVAASARSFWDAAQLLEQGSREQNVLEGFAVEEAAKVLILMDLVRCPSKYIARRVKGIVKTFYDHLSRMIYAAAQGWRPVDVTQLQTYVDQERQGHYLEGYVGEYIVPNWRLYSRESTMYADIEVHEDGKPQWSAPRGDGCSLQMFGGPPLPLLLTEAMAALGMFTVKGVRIVHQTWQALDFIDIQHLDDHRRLVREMLDKLIAAKLPSDDATDDHVWQLNSHWQLPMYNLQFGKIPVELEVLEAERNAALWHEFGI